MKNLFNKIGKLRPRAQQSEKSSGKSIFPEYMYRSYMQGPGKAMWSGRDYQRFSDEAYIKNVIAHQSIKKIAIAAASVKIKLSKDGEALDVDKHPLGKLIVKPNPCCGGTEFFESLYSYKLIAGNCYILALGADDEAPFELHSLRPDRVSIITGRDGMPSVYRYQIQGNKYKDYAARKILHLKNFHPLDDWYGLSPVEAAAYSIDQHNQSGEWNQALLQNGARPSGALIVKQANGDAGGYLSEDQYNRIKNQVDEQFSGYENAGRPLLLEGGLDWREMSLKPKDMDFINMKHSAARDIALAFGVPPQLLGIPGDNTYSNLAEARLALWEQTVIPLVEKLVEAMNSWLAPMFDGEIKISADLNNIPALMPRREALWDKVKDADFLSDEERRKLLGL